MTSTITPLFVVLVACLVFKTTCSPQFYWGLQGEYEPLPLQSGPDYYSSTSAEVEGDYTSGQSDESFDYEMPKKSSKTSKTSKGSKSSKTSKSSKDWQKKGVDVINEFRSQANLPPYKHDAKLSQGAQQWADAMAKNCNFDHSDVDSWGDANAENLADVLTYHCSDASTCAKVGIGEWMEEKKVYDCRPLTNKDSIDPNSAGSQYYMKVGHFMNLMDKTKTAAGLGFARGRGKCKDDQYLVGRFSGVDMNYYGPELKRVGGNDDLVDTAQFVPCPN